MSVEYANPAGQVMGPPPEEGDLEQIEQIRKDLGTVMVDVAGLKSKMDAELPHLATKADLHALDSKMNKTFYGVVFTLILSAMGIAIKLFHP